MAVTTPPACPGSETGLRVIKIESNALPQDGNRMTAAIRRQTLHSHQALILTHAVRMLFLAGFAPLGSGRVRDPSIRTTSIRTT